MPNAAIISIVGNIIPPELEGKYANWFNEAYAPVFMTMPAMLGIDRYLVIKENPFYPRNIVLYHRQNLQVVQEETSNSDRTAVIKDINTTFKAIEWVWYRKGYELIRSFRTDGRSGEDTRVDNTSVIHLEVPRLAPEQEEKYQEWFVRWAYPVYIPILMKLPGFKAYQRFHHSGQDFGESRDYRTRETTYPAYLSLLFFEDIKAFDNYERSPELIAFREAIRTHFPGSLDYRWYVQYRLLKSWRK